MLFTIAELRCREVVNIRDGARLGFVDDAVFDTSSGRISALTLPGRGQLFSRKSDVSIPWEAVRRIGGDIILVDTEIQKAAR